MGRASTWNPAPNPIMDLEQRNPSPDFATLVERRYRRRDVLASTLGLLGAAGLARPARAASAPTGFAPVPPSTADTFAVPAGYAAQVVLRWGDALLPGAPDFDPRRVDPAAARRQFGTSCDHNAFLPLEPAGDEGLLCTNHEYASAKDLFFGEPSDDDEKAARFEVEVASQGMSFAHLVRTAKGRFELVRDSRYNRRITGDTAMRFDGPAAGSAQLRTGGDPAGMTPLGTIANCGGGVTPWGTILTCEENFHDYFGRTEQLEDEAMLAKLKRLYVRPEKNLYPWCEHDRRFDVSQEPNEPNRFGWVVEIDPFDPTSTPIKHTALGRFEHEGANCSLSDDGRAVVHMGDDARFEYLYKFVSRDRYRPGDRAHNRTLLSRGTLHVARLDEDGTGVWIPLVPEGVLAEWSLADICVHARAAADLVGATPMDRPEDVEVEPISRRVYACMTNNAGRETPNAANPRTQNQHGQIVELIEEGGDLGATRFVWSLFMVCGDPADASDPHVSYAGRRDPDLAAVSCPDNLAFDRRGNLWLATDGQPSKLGVHDAIYVVPTNGPQRGVPQRFATGPVGCEMTGPFLARDDRTFFASVQHPGAGGGLIEPTSRWPHDATGIPRPSVVAVEREDGRPLLG